MNEKGEALKALKENGYTKKDRSGGNHDLYWNADLKSLIPISR